ncbi:MAG: T9SS type A sorting domain-containing protein [Bacteroidia bacterium]|nr:T9SS type A sorting domain-containing protein [Bacteroidia bacterium]
MKKSLHFLTLLLLLGAFSQANAQRYLTEIFSSASVTKDITYATNISVLTGMPASEDLKMDVYRPMGDTKTDRPLIVFSHTGSFLPTPANGTPTGSKRDSATVEMATQLAKRGYVVAVYDYRLGWNPVSPSQDVRTGTLLNAAYRGIQDTRTVLRYFRKDYSTNSNSYGVDTSKFIVMGQGTGGYMAYGAASLDKYSEIVLSKFLDVNANPYVDTSLSGNIWGTNTRPLNIANHASYSSNIAMGVSLGGAVGDSTWIEDGDAPVVAFHCVKDPFAPYGYGAVIVPTTLQFVVNVSGGGHVQKINQAYGNNDCYAIPAAGWTDPWTMGANAHNNGVEGIYPFFTPSLESGPWEWWDTSHVNNQAGLQTNPNMSKSKGLAYIDTIMGYANPRIVTCLGLDTSTISGVYDDILKGFLSVSPNPATNQMAVVLNHPTELIQALELRDLQGRLLKRINGINAQSYLLQRETEPAGLYLLKVISANSATTRKVMFN